MAWKEWIWNYHSFNYMKILASWERIQASVAWLDGKTSFLPSPLMIIVDPTNTCNVNCTWCKVRAFRDKKPTSIPDAVLTHIPADLKAWGVKNVMLSGGEPTLHPRIVGFLNGCKENGLAVGLKTNGTGFTNPNLRAAVLESAAWVGVSLDAASEATYRKTKRAALGTFDKILSGVEKLLEERGLRRTPIVTMKFLIQHTNYADIKQFCDIAKKLGADEVHLRPLSLAGYRYTKGVIKVAEFHLMDARKEFESDGFKIYGIVRKFGKDWDRAIRFEKCRIQTLSGVLAADKNFYLCPDRRGDGHLSLGRYDNFEDIVKAWGSDRHRELVLGICPALCPKCGFTMYNEIVEQCGGEVDRLKLGFL